MKQEIQLLSIRMVISPLPAAFRVRSTPEQFPTFVVYESGIRMLGDTLPFAEVVNLELTEGGAIRFTARGRTYQYAAISSTSKETPDEDQTERLFRVLVALKAGGLAAAQEPLTEFKQATKANTKSMLVTAILLIVLCALLAWLEESGCKKTAHKQPPQGMPRSARQP